MSVFPIQGLYTKLSVTEDLHLHGKNVIKNVYLREDFCVISCANFCSLPCFSCLQRNLCCLCLKFLFFFFIGCFACYLNYIEEALNAEVLENSSHEIYFFHSQLHLWNVTPGETTEALSLDSRNVHSQTLCAVTGCQWCFNTSQVITNFILKLILIRKRFAFSMFQKVTTAQGKSESHIFLCITLFLCGR